MYNVSGLHWNRDERSGPAQIWKSYPDENLVGWYQTLGPSGGCGSNKNLNVTMPLRLTPVG